MPLRRLTNWYSLLPTQHKLARLVDFMLAHRDDKCIVFMLTCACVDYFGKVRPTPLLTMPCRFLISHAAVPVFVGAARPQGREVGQAECAGSSRQDEAQAAHRCVRGIL